MRTLLLTLFLLAALNVGAQESKQVCGTYKYYVQANETLESARHTAIQRARISALAREFGESLSQTQTMTTKEDGRSYTDALYTSGEDYVNGEWLNDTQEPTIEQGFENGVLYILASVCGLAQAKNTAKTDLKYHVLRNGTGLQFESEDFKSGDQLYLMFQSPVDGFVSVYLIDETHTAYCLLPYRNQKKGSQKVEANHQYVFFNASGDATNTIDEYELNCDDGSGQIFNDLYIIFSENDFSKAVDFSSSATSSSGLDLPRSLPFADFLNWLNKKRTVDTKMQVEKVTVSVKR